MNIILTDLHSIEINSSTVVKGTSDNSPDSKDDGGFIKSRSNLLETRVSDQKQIDELQEQVAFLEAQLEVEKSLQIDDIRKIVQETIAPLKAQNEQVWKSVNILNEKVTSLTTNLNYQPKSPIIPIVMPPFSVS